MMPPRSGKQASAAATSGAAPPQARAAEAAKREDPDTLYGTGTSYSPAATFNILANTTLRQADISVTTNNGVVTLSGQVPSEEAHQLALGLTRNTGGVNRIEDQLKVTTTTF